MKSPSRTSRLRRRGSATLEFAILLPLLLTIALLCVDFGRFVHTYIAVTNAARAGAGFASMHPITPATQPLYNAAVRQIVEEEMTANEWFESASLTVQPPQMIDDGDGTRRVRVDVSYPFNTLINWPFLPGYNDPVVLRRVVVMRLIR